MDESKLIVISKVDVSEPIVTSKVDESKQIATNIEDTPLYKELRQYRYESSKAEGVKPYFIYNNAQMENIISTMPKNLNEIKKIPGFGDAKCLKYGNNILEILSKYN
jgi:superfamily II DNA helicase RecQ